MTNDKIVNAVLQEWQKHDAGQGVPHEMWAQLAASVVCALVLAPTYAAAPVTGNGNPADIDSAWVKSAAEAILKSNARLTPNAQTFVAQTFARASQYDTVKFSPKQWEWFNKIMLSAGVEALSE